MRTLQAEPYIPVAVGYTGCTPRDIPSPVIVLPCAVDQRTAFSRRHGRSVPNGTRLRADIQTRAAARVGLAVSNEQLEPTDAAIRWLHLHDHDVLTRKFHSWSHRGIRGDTYDTANITVECLGR